ncbi:MAG: pectinesterase family protein [Bacteroidota bacterium]|nr:pectinesterase family protein [Bacteroidota bacterium]
MKPLAIIFSLFALICISSANTIIVDINGGGQYTSINTAIINASSNDTIKVWPGTYNEPVTLNKNVVLMGSGYENTRIIGNYNPVVTISAGTIQWFAITSTGGDGIKLNAGIVKNCVIVGCGRYGILYSTGTTAAYVNNCVIYANGSYGIYHDGLSSTTGSLYAVNCISRLNAQIGFVKPSYSYGYFYVSYCNGTTSVTTGNQGNVNCDPPFNSPPLDFHIGENTSCSWNTGNPSLNDPDGSRSDMGYFGGPDCPIYPVVTEIIITPGGNTINLQAKGRANY